MQFLPKQGLLNKIGWIICKTTNLSIDLNVYPQPLTFGEYLQVDPHVPIMSPWCPTARPKTFLSFLFFFGA